MRERVGRALCRVVAPMLESLERRPLKLHRDMVGRIQQLEGRIDEVLAAQRVEARLHAARMAARGTDVVKRARFGGRGSGNHSWS